MPYSKLLLRVETGVNNYALMWRERTSHSPSPYQGGGVRQLPDGGGWEKTGFVEGQGNGNFTNSYYFVDKDLIRGKHY